MPERQETPAAGFSGIQARPLVADLFTPNPFIYWADLLGSALGGHLCFGLVRLLPFLLPGLPWLSWPLRGLAFVGSVLLYYRAAMFIHELAHLKRGTFWAFRCVWNLLIGIPMLTPIREVELLTAVKKEDVEDARRALEAAETNLRFTQVRAPFPGVVVKRYRHLGDFASPGVAILSMYNPDLIYVTANLEETRLRGVAPGNPVKLQLDAFAEPFGGRVVWLDKSTGAQFSLMPRNVASGEFTKVVQRVPVRIAIDRDDRWPLLRAGLSVRVAIAHGKGDPQWAEQAAREMKDLETRHNQPQPADRGAAAGDQP
jgi:hypothetical protein